MLVTLTLNETKAADYNKRIDEITKEYPEWNRPKVTTLDREFMPYAWFSVLDGWENYIVLRQDYRKDFDGVYVCGLNDNYLLEVLTNYRDARKLQSFYEYGVADNASQIMDFYDNICREHTDYMNTHKFVILLTPIFKADQPEMGGWRWHKWGPYIGVHDIKCEYLYDEKEIDYVYVFHILEVEEC